MDFGAALASAAQALKTAKQLREIDGEMDVAELKAKMADLYINVAEVRMALADAQEAVRAKERTAPDWFDQDDLAPQLAPSSVSACRTREMEEQREKMCAGRALSNRRLFGPTKPSPK